MDAIRLSLIVIRAANPEALAAYYGAIGLRFLKHRHGNGPEHFSAELNDNAVFEIYPLKVGDAPTSAMRIGFRVTSVEEAFSALILAGGKVSSAPKLGEWGLRAVVDDPEGHRIELTQLKSDADGSSALHDA